MDDQVIILLVLVAMFVMFLWGKWRHDMVALGALLSCVLLGQVDPAAAFAGFGHPAVVTVACVLVLSRGLQTSGAIDIAARTLLPRAAAPSATIAALVGLGALLSGVMNNVGAMALLMPIAVQASKKLDLAPGQVLMPLSFGTILGGMTTLIGTPPNLIVSGFRAGLPADEGGFAMFDFAPVGGPVALVGVAFIAAFGWRIVPARHTLASEGFATGAYLTEAYVPEGCAAIGLTVREAEAKVAESGAQIIGLVRDGRRVTAPPGGRRIHEDDILILEAEAEELSDVVSTLGLRLEESGEGAAADEAATEEPAQDEVVLMELVVRPGSALIGRSAGGLRLRSRHGINLLAVSRHGRRPTARLRTMRIAAGDLLLMQGSEEALQGFASENGAVPLAERDLSLPDGRQALIATGIMAGAVAGAALGLVPAAISFAMGVLASMALGTVPPRRVYDAIDWPVIVLLAALLPVAGAMETTGAADSVADFLLASVAQGHTVVALTVILVVTMFLSDVMNNAATAAVLCPIAVGTAAALGVNPDTFLMAVAVGASCAFLTPIGHQNNTLILGPGGFGFRDYWRLGLPLEVIIVAVAVPLLLLVWPLQPG